MTVKAELVEPIFALPLAYYKYPDDKHKELLEATRQAIKKVQDTFRELVDAQANNELSDYSLRKIGSLLEDFIRKLLKDGELSYNPNSRVMNYSMGLPRTQELL